MIKFELRIQFASDQIRLLYFFWSKNTCVITNGFIKKSQKIPRRPLDLARKYKTEYESRKHDE